MCTVCGPAAEKSAFLGIRGKSAATSLDNRQSEADELNQARGRVSKFKLQRAAQKLLPEESVARCHRFNKERLHNPGVDVMVNRVTGRASFGNVVTCGSVWHCPVCGAKISEGRRAELQGGMVTHHARGGRVYLLTLTYPHDRTMKLSDSLASLSSMLRKFKATRVYKETMRKAGSKGSVRSLEVTHGENGWHPHTHELVFVDGSSSSDLELIESLRAHWGKAVFRELGAHINEHGFDVRSGDAAAEYVAKFGRDASGWTAAHEITKSNVKKGRKGSRSPFDILRDYMAGCAQSGALFVEYATEFKGKRQLFYSRGLKEYLAIEEISDEQLAESQKEKDEQEMLGTISEQDWLAVLRNNARGEVLEIAQRHGWEGVQFILEKMRASLGSDEPWYRSVRRFICW